MHFIKTHLNCVRLLRYYLIEENCMSQIFAYHTKRIMFYLKKKHLKMFYFYMLPLIKKLKIGTTAKLRDNL